LRTVRDARVRGFLSFPLHHSTNHHLIHSTAPWPSNAVNPFNNKSLIEGDDITGKSVKHGFAKDMLAGIVGAEVGKLFDNRGLGDYDRGKAKHHAMKQAGYLYDQQYGQYDQYDP
jgi:hypothetical protein